MSVVPRLALYGAGLVAAFGVAFVVAGTVVPANVVEAWSAESEFHAGYPETDAYRLSEVEAPNTPGEAGHLRFRILDAAGAPLAHVDTEHGVNVVVIHGSDVHQAVPDADTDVWTLPWMWDNPGTHRLIVDLVAPDTDGPIIVARTIEVAGR